MSIISLTWARSLPTTDIPATTARLSTSLSSTSATATWVNFAFTQSGHAPLEHLALRLERTRGGNVEGDSGYVAVAEVEDNDVLNRAVVAAMSVVGNERAHVNEMMDEDSSLHGTTCTQWREGGQGAQSSRSAKNLLPPPAGRGCRQEMLDISSSPFPGGGRSLAQVEGLGGMGSSGARQAPPPVAVFTPTSAPRKTKSRRKSASTNEGEERPAE